MKLGKLFVKVLLSMSHASTSPSCRNYEPTPPPKEGLKFAPQREGKTQKYVPVRRTPVYNPSTPTYSVTPPAIAFEPTEPLKKNKSPSTPSPGVFKISVRSSKMRPKS